MTKAQIYLASASPRRRELLRQIQVPFVVLSVAVDESPLPAEAPAALVARLAMAKARAGWRQVAGGTRPRPLPVLGADTVVVVDERVLGKPGDATEARNMLQMLAGRCHEVYSAVALVGADYRGVRCNRSEVCLRALAPAEILRYGDSGEPRDKAGGYGIQGLAAAFVQSLNGSYSGVMGLPLFETASLLAEARINFWLTGERNE